MKKSAQSKARAAAVMEIDSDRDAMEEDGGDEGSAEEGKSPETVSPARCTRSMLTD